MTMHNVLHPIHDMDYICQEKKNEEDQRKLNYRDQK